MIEIKDKKDCCGCWACVQRCPKSCITMREDGEGFLYPEIDKTSCINCGLCERVCPVVNQSEGRKPQVVYAAKHQDEQIRMASSSGGVFTALAESVIDAGGIVFGAQFDKDWSVVHGHVETKEGLSAFRGSKYVQSKIGSSYQEAEQFLKAGRKVLFSGTPCQIAGLKRFLRKEYDNLLTVDFICHGVPSPGVWRQYLKEETARQCGRKNSVLSRSIHESDTLIEGISFRDKTLGWKKYSFALVLSTTNGSGEKYSFCSRTPLNRNPFMRGFLSDLYLRPSCYNCPARALSSGSDVTIGDFWGIESVMPEIDDDRGTSVVMVHTSRALQILEKLDMRLWTTRYEDVLQYNPAIERSPQLPQKRAEFFAENEKTFLEKIKHLLPVSYKRYVINAAFVLFGKHRVERFIRFVKRK